MRRTLIGLVAALLLTTATLAEDFWVKKDYTQWTDEEVKKLMTNSPWAKDITVSAPLAAVGRRGPGQASGAGPSGVDVETGAGAGGRGRRGGGGGRGGGFGDDGGGTTTEALITLNMSWRSALPLRKAIVRSRIGADAAVPPEAKDLITKDETDYVIVLTGVPAPMARVLQNVEALNECTLRAGKKAPIAAKSVSIQPRTQSVDVLFFFPKKDMIAADDKEVEVVLKLGRVEAKKKFNLKDMVYNGKLEL